MWSLAATALLAATGATAQVTATFPNGVTNPEKPEFLPVGSQVNQTSFSRLLSLNGVDDFCLFAPPEPGPDSLIGNVEPIVVAYCTKPRNNARLIPDGAITAAHLIKTPLYVQIYGFWDGTAVNIPQGDSGGELDPHGAENLGNPIGGNVTTNLATGNDVFYEEWMSFISYDQFCLRICTAETGNITAALQCEHEMDILGCRYVMAIEDYYTSNGTFTSCEGEPAPPPGLYVQPDGSTSTFRQRFTGTWTDKANNNTGMFTVGQTVTPSAPAFWPKTSNCVTYSTISNGVDINNYMVTAAPVLLQPSGSASTVSVPTTSLAVTATYTKAAVNTAAASAPPSQAVTTGQDGKPTPDASASAGTGSAAGSAAGSGASALAAPIGAAAVIGAALAGFLAVF